MATFYGTTFSGSSLDAAASPPFDTPHGAKTGGKLRCITEKFTMAAQASGSILVLGKLPIGAIFKGVRLTASATVGASATLEIGIAGSTAKYRAAATFTTADTPTLYGPAAAMAQAPLAAEEIVICTTAVASLAAAGTLVFELFYTTAA
jgi:hypothetical protein